MPIAKRSYFIWLATFVCLAVFANWPIRTGQPVGFLVFAGFPWKAATWTGGRLANFYAQAFAWDVAIWLLLVVVVPVLLARRK